MGNKETRAKKLAEIWKQLTWLEENTLMTPYMGGKKITHADMTWFPTCVFMEFMLPRVFKWSKVFREREVFPKLGGWYEGLLENEVFNQVRTEIWDFWVAKEEA